MIRYNQVIDKSLKASATYDDAQTAWELMNLSYHVVSYCPDTTHVSAAPPNYTKAIGIINPELVQDKLKSS